MTIPWPQKERTHDSRNRREKDIEEAKNCWKLADEIWKDPKRMEELARVNDNNGKQSEKESNYNDLGPKGNHSTERTSRVGKKVKQLELGACGNTFDPLHQRLHQLDGDFYIKGN